MQNIRIIYDGRMVRKVRTTKTQSSFYFDHTKTARTSRGRFLSNPGAVLDFGQEIGIIWRIFVAPPDEKALEDMSVGSQSDARSHFPPISTKGTDNEGKSADSGCHIPCGLGMTLSDDFEGKPEFEVNSTVTVVGRAQLRVPQMDDVPLIKMKPVDVVLDRSFCKGKIGSMRAGPLHLSNNQSFRFCCQFLGRAKT